jgi:TPP-dependent 2-oxoacid decarboxylase
MTHPDVLFKLVELHMPQEDAPETMKKIAQSLKKQNS